MLLVGCEQVGDNLEDNPARLGMVIDETYAHDCEA
jgi:hypothetical protein